MSDVTQGRMFSQTANPFKDVTTGERMKFQPSPNGQAPSPPQPKSTAPLNPSPIAPPRPAAAPQPPPPPVTPPPQAAPPVATIPATNQAWMSAVTPQAPLPEATPRPPLPTTPEEAWLYRLLFPEVDTALSSATDQGPLAALRTLSAQAASRLG